MRNYNFAPISACWQSLNSGLDDYHSTSSSDISMMLGNNNFNGYVEDGFNCNNSDQICYGSIDQFTYLSPALHSSIISTTNENMSIGATANLVDYPWSSPCETTKIDPPHVQSCKPTIKDVRKSVNGAKHGQRNSITSVEASRVSKKKKDIEQLIKAQRLKISGRKSQKLSDKIATLQEIVSPYGKTDTASVLQEACQFISMFHHEIRRLSISYYEGRSLHSHLQGHQAERKGDLKSKGLCLVPISIMNRLTREMCGDQHHNNVARNIRRPDFIKF